MQSLTFCSGTCSLQCFTGSDDLDHSLQRLTVSEDAVTHQQAEEDLRLYGSRPVPFNPSDSWETDNPFGLRLPPLKRSASDLEEQGRPPKVSKTNGLELSSHQNVVTAMDWNSGTSPLDSWLNQSAVPSFVPPVVEGVELPSHDALIKQEEEEIKAFRRVHINMAPDPPSTNLNMNADEHFAALTLEAQIHYRNIRDKYPLIPSYLASRLAEANVERADRLRQKRLAIAKKPADTKVNEKDADLDDVYHPRMGVHTGRSHCQGDPTLMGVQTGRLNCEGEPKKVRLRCSYCRMRNVQPPTNPFSSSIMVTITDSLR